MNEKCKTCKEEFDQGIWISPQFADEKVLLFCSNKCKKKYLKRKLERIKSGYPEYYKKIMKFKKEKGFLDFDLGRKKEVKNWEASEAVSRLGFLPFFKTFLVFQRL